MTEREIAIDTPEFEKLTMARVSRRLHTLILFMLKWNLNFAKLLPAINYISQFFPRYLIAHKQCATLFQPKMMQLFFRGPLIGNSWRTLITSRLLTTIKNSTAIWFSDHMAALPKDNFWAVSLFLSVICSHSFCSIDYWLS